MDSVKTRGIIARRADYAEANAMLTVFSRELGVISVCAYGVRSGKSKLKAATQLYCLGDFILSKKTGDIYKLDSLELVESFYPLCEDIEKLALSGYLTELALDAAMGSDEKVLSLLLNTLYVLAYKDTDTELAKAVFELKLSALSGYEPKLDGCMYCESEEVSGFDFSGGCVCSSCKRNSAADVSLGTLSAMRYILTADEKKLFSFEVSDEVRRQLSAVAEKYISEKTERSYKSLDYYNKIKRK